MHVHFIIKMADVANNRVILHLLHVFDCDDALVSSRCYEYVALLKEGLKLPDMEAFHTGLQGANRV